MREPTRKNCTGEFTATVALDASRGLKTVNDIGQECEVHPTQGGMGKKELHEQASSLCDATRGPNPADPSASPERLYSEIGRLKMDLDWLKKSLGSANSNAHAMGPHPRTLGTDPAMRTGGHEPLHGLCATNGRKTGRADIGAAGPE